MDTNYIQQRINAKADHQLKKELRNMFNDIQNYVFKHPDTDLFPGDREIKVIFKDGDLKEHGYVSSRAIFTPGGVLAKLLFEYWKTEYRKRYSDRFFEAIDETITKKPQTEE